MILLRLTPMVKILLGAFVGMFFLQKIILVFASISVVAWLGLVPIYFFEYHRYWQIVTYAFLHGGLIHLLFNSLVLVFLGGELEARLGSKHLLGLFLFSSTVAGILYLVLVKTFYAAAIDYRSPLVGASGGIMGFLMAYGLLFSQRQLLFFFVIPMKAWTFVWVIIAFEFFTTLTGRSSSAMSSFVHLSGIVAGYFYLLALARYNRSRRQF